MQQCGAQPCWHMDTCESSIDVVQTNENRRTRPRRVLEVETHSTANGECRSPEQFQNDSESAEGVFWC